MSKLNVNWSCEEQFSVNIYIRTLFIDDETLKSVDFRCDFLCHKLHMAARGV